MTRAQEFQIEDDDRWKEARSLLVHSLGPGFREFGEFLWVGGYIIGGDRVSGRSPFGFGSDAVVGLAIVAQMGGELCAGAAASIYDYLTAAAHRTGYTLATKRERFALLGAAVSA